MKKTGLAGKLVRKTILIMVLLFAVALVILSLVLSGQVKATTNEKLMLSADNISQETAEFFKLHAAITEQYAKDLSVISFMESEKANPMDLYKHPQWDTVQKQLESTYDLYSDTLVELYIASWYVQDLGSSTGDVMSRDYPGGLDIYTRYWLTGPKETGQTVYTAPYVDGQTGNVVCTIASPITNANGEFLGSVCIDFYLTRVRDVFAGTKVGEEGYAMAFLDDGSVFYNPNEAYMELRKMEKLHTMLRSLIFLMNSKKR